MKRLFTIALLTMLTVTLMAQNRGKKFDPNSFLREQEAFITKEAGLTQQEANAFFPVFREMQGKMRSIFNQQRELMHKHVQNDGEAQKIISTADNLDMQLKKIQQTYHVKFCKVISARKVMKCIQAEEHFKHNMMARFANQNRDNRHR